MHKILLFFIGLIIGGTIAVPGLHAKDAVSLPSTDLEFDDILSQDISGLTVTSVAKRSQRLSDTAAAVYVITQDELRRAGIYSIPEALRLVPGMQVAKIGVDRWAISARGFNGAITNKLLVLIDGRTIYTPVFSGTYWGDQSTSINDIDRIEVIRGPGASLYGANAVNGVVNIITKSAEDTQGNMVSATATARGNGIYEARHGGKIGENDYYRAYGQYYDADSWYRMRGGFRVDGKNSEGNSYTLQGDAYGGQQDANLMTPRLSPPYISNVASEDDAYGGNMLGRWNHRLSNDSEMSLQAYIDHYSRLESNFDQHVTTADVQLQHSMHPDERNHFIWGAGARLNYLELESTFSAQVKDRYDTHEVVSAFLQDEYALIPKILYFTAGSKFEYNDFTGFEVQPSGRLTWHPTPNQTVWGAVSRAVRTPSSIEEDVSLAVQVVPTTPLTEYRVIGNKNQKSEELIAYELGHRIQPTNNLSFDSSFFYNDFDKLQTIATPGAAFTGATGNTIIPYPVNNLGSGHVYGAELSANWTVTRDWRLSGSYTYLRMNLDVEPGTATTLEAGERLAPRNQFSVQSYYNFTDAVHFDNMLYYVDHIASIDDYLRYDARLAWLIQPGLEVSLIGRNLLGSHEEFPTTPQTEVDRSFIGQVLWKF